MSAYADAVAAELEGVEAVSVGGCEGCGDCYDPDEPEPAFSWATCDGCGSTFGGNRFPGHGLIDGELHHFEFCTDCVMYIANGDEPEEWRRTP